MRVTVPLDAPTPDDESFDFEFDLGHPDSNLGVRTFRVKNRMSGWEMIRQAKMAGEFRRTAAQLNSGDLTPEEAEAFSVQSADALWRLFERTIHPDDFDAFQEFVSDYEPTIGVDKLFDIASAIRQQLAGGDVPLDTSKDSSTGPGRTGASSKGSSSSTAASGSNTSTSAKSSTPATRSASKAPRTKKKSGSSTGNSG